MQRCNLLIFKDLPTTADRKWDRAWNLFANSGIFLFSFRN